MQSREQVRGMVLGRTVDRTRAGQVGHDEKIRGAVDHLGHRQVAAFGEVAKHRRLTIQLAAGTAKLRDQRRAIVKINPVDLGNTATVQRCNRRRPSANRLFNNLFKGLGH